MICYYLLNRHYIGTASVFLLLNFSYIELPAGVMQCVHLFMFVCSSVCLCADIFVLPAGMVRPVVGRLVMHPVFVQSVTVKLYTW